MARSYQALSSFASVAAAKTSAVCPELTENSRRATIRPGAPGRSSLMLGGWPRMSPSAAIARPAPNSCAIPSVRAAKHSPLSAQAARVPRYSLPGW
jgi:hypothetical protein